MESDTFRAGVAPGGPGSRHEIKVLICYVLRELETGISFSALHEALDQYALVNYFALIEALEQLCGSGHVLMDTEDGVEVYRAGGPAAEVVREFGASLPLSVREKAVKAAKQVMGRQRRLSEVRASVTGNGEGYLLDLAIPAQGDSLLSLQVFAPTASQRDNIRRRFLNDPEFIYQGVMALLTGERSLLEKTFPQEDGLF